MLFSPYPEILASVRIFSKKIRPPNSDHEYRGRKLLSVVPPQFTAVSQQRPYQVLIYLSSVTGTPVASYLRFLPFSALLTEGIQNGRPLCLAPTGNSLEVLSKSTCF